MATTNPIVIPVKTKGLSDLQKLEKRMEALERDASKLTRTLPKTSNAIRQTGRAAGTATTNVQRFGIAFRSTIAPLVAVYGTVTALSRSLSILAERESDTLVLARNLQNIGLGTAKLEELQAVADKLDLSTLFNSEDFNKGFALLTSFKSIGVDSYERVSKAAADLATITGTDLKSAQLQLAKALENPVEGMSALSRSGTTFTKSQKEFVKSLVESNQELEAQAYILNIVEGQYNGAAQAAAGGYAGALDTLSKRWRDVNEQIAKVVQPAATAFLNALSGYLLAVTTELGKTAQALGVLSRWAQQATGFIKGLGEQFQIAAGKTYQFFQRLSEVVGLGSQFAGFGTAIANNIDEITSAAIRSIPIIGQYFTVLDALKTLRGGINKAGAIGGTGVDSNPTQGADLDMEGIRDQQRWADLMKGFQTTTATSGGSGGGSAGKDRVKLASDLLEKQQREIELLGATSNLEKDLLKIEHDRLDVIKQIAEIDPAMQGQATENANDIAASQRGSAIGEALAEDLQKVIAIKKAQEDALRPLQDRRRLLDAQLVGKGEEVRIELEIERIMRSTVGLQEAEVRALVQGNAERQKQFEKMEEMKELAGSISDTLENGLVNALGTAVEGLITGAEDLDESLKKILQGVLKDIANQMIKAGISSLFQSIGGGGGGGIFAGLFRAEGGPVAGGQSYIVGEKGPEIFTPGLTGNITSNSDSKAAMANYSGGNASSAGAMAPMAANVTYSGPTLNFNGDDYIPRSEATALVAAGAKQGQARTLATLKNSRAQRSKLGM